MSLASSLVGWIGRAALSVVGALVVSSQPIIVFASQRILLSGPPPGLELPLSSNPAGAAAIGAEHAIRNGETLAPPVTS